MRKDLGNHLMSLEKSGIAKLNESVAKDSKFLAEHNIMDYSLLLVIETVPEYHPKFESRKASPRPSAFLKQGSKSKKDFTRQFSNQGSK